MWSGGGCDACNRSGFAGRTGVYECCASTSRCAGWIHDGAGEMALRDAATRSGMRSLRGDGARWIVEGRTSLAELTRVTRDA